MTLPSSGSISFSQVNDELGRAFNTQISLGEASVRNLAGVGSGTIGFGNLLGKTVWVPSLAPNGNTAFGTGTAKIWTVECGGAPVGSTYVWSFSGEIGVWTITQGQNTDTATIRGSGAIGGDSVEAVVVCAVTYLGVTKTVSANFEYINTSAP